MADGPPDLPPADAPAPAGGSDARAHVDALIAAARDLSDTCADLADELRPATGSDGSPADRAAALLDEAASAVRATLALLGAAGSALDEPEGPMTEPHPTVAIPAQAAVAQDPFTLPSPWAATAPSWTAPPEAEEPAGEPARDADQDLLPAPRAVATTWPDAFSKGPARSVPEEDLIAAGSMDRYEGAEIGAHLDLPGERAADPQDAQPREQDAQTREQDEELVSAAPAALAGWLVLDPDDEASGEPVALEHRPTGPIPVIPVAAAESAGGPTMLTVDTGDPYADDPEPYGEVASTEPRSLSLVPPLPAGDGPEEDTRDPVSELPPPVDLPDPTEPEQADVATLAATGSGPWVPETATATPWTPPAQQAYGTDLPEDPWPGRSVWAVEPAPGSAAFGDGLPVYPLDELEPEPGLPDLPMTPVEAALPPEPVDDPSAAVVARQVEAARRHLQAALVVSNKGDKLGALLTAVEQALTAVTDLARETRGVLPEFLADRTFPGEARFLCASPWETVELVGRDAYGRDPATTAGLARLLRSLGYDAESVTSASGVSGVQIREERYAAHVALVEPAGGGRQRWSGALEWTDRTGAGRTWAETLGPVELPEDELAHRVDELLRRSVGAG